MRRFGSGLGSAGFAVFDDSACMVRAAQLYSRFLFVESCGQCPACKFGTGEVTSLLEKVEAEGASDQDLETILMRARGSTDGQKCALPTGESLLMQSLVQVFGGRVPQPRRRRVSPPSRAHVPQDRRLGPGGRQVPLRRGLREQAVRLDVRRLTAVGCSLQRPQRHHAVVVAEEHVSGAERHAAERHRDIDLAESRPCPDGRGSSRSP